MQKHLEGQLEMQIRLVEEFRAVCERLRRESVAERRQRAVAALAVAQDIAVERAGTHLFVSIAPPRRFSRL